MTPSRLALIPDFADAWEACEKATPGPWWIDAGGPDEECDLVGGDNRKLAGFPFYAPHRHRPTEEFVCLSRTALPTALETVATLRAELAEAQAALDNESGRGEPPGPGWRADGYEALWSRDLAVDDCGDAIDSLLVYATEGGESRWERWQYPSRRVAHGTAPNVRAAMRTADASTEGEKP